MNLGRWHRVVSLRASLVLVPAVLCALLALALGAAVIGQARQRVESERLSAVTIADHLVAASLTGLSPSSPDPLGALTLRLQELAALRHVRLFVLPTDESGYRAFQARPRTAGPVPGWFIAMLGPPAWERWRQVWLGGRALGYVVVCADPVDEIAELWKELELLLILLGGMVAIFTALVAWSVSRAMRPVTLLEWGLGRLEKGHYEETLPPFVLPELAPLSDTFNTLAATLRRMDADNRRLIAGLLSVQEAERNLLAAELHDELGPTLFGIRAHASCLLRDPSGRGAAEILRLADDVQRLNRRILDRLRPSLLNDLGLEAALAQLVADWSLRLPDVAWRCRVGGLGSVGDGELALALYRVAQEALTNAARHSGAGCVTLEAGRAPAQDLPWAAKLRNDGGGGTGLLWMVVRDDGRGIDPVRPPGFGMAGMRERIRCRHGIILVESAEGKGTAVMVAVSETAGEVVSP